MIRFGTVHYNPDKDDDFPKTRLSTGLGRGDNVGTNGFPYNDGQGCLIATGRDPQQQFNIGIIGNNFDYKGTL